MPSSGALLFLLLATASWHALAFDPSPLQDFCVADLNSQVFVNGFPCKDANDVKVDDFVFEGIDKPRDTANMFGSNVTGVTVNQLAGLNTLGISLARIDYGPHGLIAPHTHPRATEVLTVIKGMLYAGFVTSPPESRLFSKILKAGDIIVFPIAQIHFQMNVKDEPAVALSSFGSQFPGVIPIAPTLFGSNPSISDDVLAKAFQIDKKLVDRLQAIF